MASDWSSVAVPEKVTRPPGVMFSVGGVVGGVTAIGWATLTVGGDPDESTMYSATAQRVSDCPAVSTAIAPIFQWPSLGSVTSCCHVVLTAPGTSGSIRNVV